MCEASRPLRAPQRIHLPAWRNIEHAPNTTRVVAKHEHLDAMTLGPGVRRLPAAAGSLESWHERHDDSDVDDSYRRPAWVRLRDLAAD